MSSRDPFPVTLDAGRMWGRKPSKPELGGITRRMQGAGPSLVGAGELCEHIRRGGTWAPGTFEASSNGWGRFEGARLFGLDFDHIVSGPPWQGSSFVGILERARSLSLSVLCFYPTFSAQLLDGANPAGWTRFRLVIDAGETIADESEARAALAWLLAQFPEADKQCSNLNRLFIGAPGIVAEAWPWWPSVVGGGEL